MITSESFNSQPHARLTNTVCFICHNFSSFNSQPHARLTFIATSAMFRVRDFQFTASYEADQMETIIEALSLFFQFTACLCTSVNPYLFHFSTVIADSIYKDYNIVSLETFQLSLLFFFFIIVITVTYRKYSLSFLTYIMINTFV